MPVPSGDRSPDRETPALVGEFLLRTKWSMETRLRRRRSLARTTYSRQSLTTPTEAVLPFDESTLKVLRALGRPISALARRVLAHEFQISGVEWSSCKRSTAALNAAGSRHAPVIASFDRNGDWLRGCVNASNAAESAKIWRLVSESYSPIDWQLDPKSGYRWRERDWSGDVNVAGEGGADIVAPLTLARMQHLSWLAWSHAIASDDNAMIPARADCMRAFRDQVLDFIATNPPGFGIHWSRPGEVGIRLVNWLAARDLFVAGGANFDEPFEREFWRSVHSHGRALVRSIAQDSCSRVADRATCLCGLAFVSARYPSSPRTDAWFALAIQELIALVRTHFHEEGTLASPSPSIHAFVAEAVAYATAVVQGVMRSRPKVLNEYQFKQRSVGAKLRPAPMPVSSHCQWERTPFPAWYWERLEGMAAFLSAMTRPDGSLAPIGDCGLGNTLILPRECGQIARSTGSTVAVLADNASGDFRDVTRAIAALGSGQAPAGESSDSLARRLVLRLAGQDPASEDSRSTAAQLQARANSSAIETTAFPKFGVYIMRSRRLTTMIRSGGRIAREFVKQAHCDELAITVSADGQDFLVDPGAPFSGSGAPRYDAFRSAEMHNTLCLLAPNRDAWTCVTADRVSLWSYAGGRATNWGDGKFTGTHQRYGAAYRRNIQAAPLQIDGRDELPNDREKSLVFHMAPEVRVRWNGGSRPPVLVRGETRLEISASVGAWTLEASEFSPARGVVVPTRKLVLRTTSESVDWTIRVVDG